MLCSSPWLAGRSKASEGMINIQVAIATGSRGAKSSHSPSPPLCWHTRTGRRVLQELCPHGALGAPRDGGALPPPTQFLASRSSMCWGHSGAAAFGHAAFGGGCARHHAVPATGSVQHGAAALLPGPIQGSVPCWQLQCHHG